jgi:hypothetical protein
MFLNPFLYDSEEAERIMNHLNNPDFYLKSLDEYQRMQQLIFLNEQLTALLDVEDLNKIQIITENKHSENI